MRDYIIVFENGGWMLLPADPTYTDSAKTALTTRHGQTVYTLDGDKRTLDMIIVYAKTRRSAERAAHRYIDGDWEAVAAAGKGASENGVFGREGGEG